MLVCVLDGGVVWRLLPELSVKVRSFLTAEARRDVLHVNRRNYSLNRYSVGPALNRRIHTHAGGLVYGNTAVPAEEPWGGFGSMLAQRFQRWADIGPPPQRGHSGSILTTQPAISLHTCTITLTCIQYTPRRQPQQTH